MTDRRPCDKCGLRTVALVHQRLCRECWRSTSLALRRRLRELDARILDARNSGDGYMLGALVASKIETMEAIRHD